MKTRCTNDISGREISECTAIYSIRWICYVHTRTFSSGSQNVGSEYTAIYSAICVTITQKFSLKKCFLQRAVASCTVLVDRNGR